MAVTTAAIASTAIAGYSAYNGAKQQQRAANAAVDAAGRSYYGVGGAGNAGGYSYAFNPAGVSLDYGDTGNALNSLFGGLSLSNLGQAATSNGLPFNVQQAQATLSSLGQLSQFDPSLTSMAGLSGRLGTAFDNAANAYAGLGQATAPGQSNLATTAFNGAAQQAAAASQGFGDVFNSTLQTLRDQAAPFEQRQLNGLNQNLFSTGRLGTSGGALQTEAFARGLGQADLSRQLAATDQARLTQQQALQQAQGLSGIGSNVLNDALQNFGTTSQLYNNTLQQRFANSALINNQNFNQGQQQFSNSLQLAALPTQLQSGLLNNALIGLQGQQGLQGLGLNLANFGLNSNQVAGNLALGNTSNVVAAAQNPNLGATSDVLGQFFSGLGTRALGGNSIIDLLSGFGGPSVSQQYGSGAAANQALRDAGFG